jgi:hypothetical protein
MTRKRLPLHIRLRRKLRRLRHDDAREAAASTPEAEVKKLRARLNEQNPHASPEQIEAAIALRIAAGSRPTTAVVPVSPGIPQEVLAARRSERKRRGSRRS